MLGWFEIVVCSTVFFGLQGFALKVAAEKKCNTATVFATFFAVAWLLALIAVLLTKQLAIGSSLFVLFAIANAIAGFVAFTAHLESLKRIPLIIAFPIRSMDFAFAALAGLLFFSESLSSLQALGIGLAVVVIVVLSADKHVAAKTLVSGLALAILSMLAFSAADVTLKLAAGQGSKFLFILLTYGLMFFPAFLLQKRMAFRGQAPLPVSLKLGVIAGVINFIAFYTLLTALESGPMSLVFPVIAMAIPLTILLGIAFYKEKVTKNRLVGVVLAVLVLALMGL